MKTLWRMMILPLSLLVTIGASAEYIPTDVQVVAIAKKKSVAKKKLHIKKQQRPLAPVRPRIAKDYTPPPLGSGGRMAERVSAYKYCMYSETDDRIAFALELNLEFRDDPDLKGAPKKIAYEVCLADALGLKRYEFQGEIDAAKGVELFPIVSEYINHPGELTGERRFARPWVRDYALEVATAMHQYFANQSGAGSSSFLSPEPLRVTSLIRSFKDQRRQRNSPASCVNEICSTHTTGGAIDFSNSSVYVGAKERAWIKERLLEDRQKGKIVMIQEFSPPHFHVFVIPPEYRPKEIVVKR